MAKIGDGTFDMRHTMGNLSEAQARNLVAPILTGAVGPGIKRVNFSHWSLADDSTAVLCEAMEKLPDLESVILVNIVTGRPELAGLNVFRLLGKTLCKRRLREIDLSDNAVGYKGVEALNEALSYQHDLRTLIFKNCGMSAEACRGVADVVLFRVPTQLRTLTFDNNMSGDGGAIALADIVRASPYLDDIQFTSSRSQRDGGLALAAALAEGPIALRRVDLHDNIFTTPVAVELARWLATSASASGLVELDLSDILMKDEGLAAVANAILLGTPPEVAPTEPSAAAGGAAAPTAPTPLATSLRVLRLGANEITDAGAVHLARLLVHLPHIEALHFGGNDFGDDGALIIAQALVARRAKRAADASASPVDTLRDLNVGASYLTDTGAVALAWAASHALLAPAGSEGLIPAAAPVVITPGATPAVLAAATAAAAAAAGAAAAAAAAPAPRRAVTLHLGGNEEVTKAALALLKRWEAEGPPATAAAARGAFAAGERLTIAGASVAEAFEAGDEAEVAELAASLAASIPKDAAAPAAAARLRLPTPPAGFTRAAPKPSIWIASAAAAAAAGAAGGAAATGGAGTGSGDVDALAAAFEAGVEM